MKIECQGSDASVENGCRGFLATIKSNVKTAPLVQLPSNFLGVLFYSVSFPFPGFCGPYCHA